MTGRAVPVMRGYSDIHQSPRTSPPAGVLAANHCDFTPSAETERTLPSYGATRMLEFIVCAALSMH